MAFSGPFTVDGLPAQLLYQEFLDGLALYNTRSNVFMDQFCLRTTQKTVRIDQSAAQMKAAGLGTVEPPITQPAYTDITLADSIPYEVAVGYTKKAVEKGIHSEELRNIFRDGLKADGDLIQQLILGAIMTDGSLWDANMSTAPPQFLSNTFATTHDHYLAYNVSGVPALTHVSALKLTITHHGYGRNGAGVVGFWNSAQAEKWARLAEPVTQYAWSSTMMDTLQRLGVPLEGTFTIDGVPMIVNDWIPENYIVAAAVGVKSVRWRDPEGLGTGAPLILATIDDFVQGTQMLRRWGSATVVLRGAAAVAYLGGASYTSPTHWSYL